VLAFCGSLLGCAAVLGCGGSSGPAGYGAEAFTEATLVVDPAGASVPKDRYSVASGDRVVLVFDKDQSGALLTLDTDASWVVALELPADAIGRGAIDLSGAEVRAFGRVASGEVTYLSHHATGEVTVEASGEESVEGTVRVSFEQEDVDLLGEGPLELEGDFTAILLTAPEGG